MHRCRCSKSLSIDFLVGINDRTQLLYQIGDYFRIRCSFYPNLVAYAVYRVPSIGIGPKSLPIPILDPEGGVPPLGGPPWASRGTPSGGVCSPPVTPLGRVPLGSRGPLWEGMQPPWAPPLGSRGDPSGRVCSPPGLPGDPLWGGYATPLGGVSPVYGSGRPTKYGSSERFPNFIQ